MIKWFQCEYCPYKTKWNYVLKNHTLLKHTNPENVKWSQCEDCSYRTIWKHHLQRHILNTKQHENCIYKIT
ncbi:hypothetical protein BDFB_013925 [Asbolus verrucosus]|uniref:C2H2-type domain-containing protein n=1 Tax=Asbolus verrucosus TaxID=1661398 RepID=A0A482VXP5_ASBVE|nr:hypothetical protein BDFB_013925 [Asbolus verrucosus]